MSPMIFGMQQRKPRDIYPRTWTFRYFADLDLLQRSLVQELSNNSGHRQGRPDQRAGTCRHRSVRPKPPNVIHALHFQRACKTEHELTLMRQASIQGAQGHKAAEAAFAGGASEFGVHLAFLQASGMNEWQLPYGNIVAQNQHASLLHYQYQDREPAEKMNSMLIDAGANVDGYASDITRPTLVPNCLFSRGRQPLRGAACAHAGSSKQSDQPSQAGSKLC